MGGSDRSGVGEGGSIRGSHVGAGGIQSPLPLLRAYNHAYNHLRFFYF